MSATRDRPGSFRPAPKKTIPTVNLIPFVDCLMVIVAYLLLNASYARLAHLSSTIGRPATEQGPANLEGYLTVILHDTGVLTFGSQSDSDVFTAIPPKKKGEIDGDSFARFLARLPRHYKHVVLVPTPYSPYRDLARLTAISQRDLRAVVLSPAVGKGI